ncbi:hypothetical protein [Salinimonas chungwhensis]|uniref:hypothetical protein n=1 Tax=Salinimonas chungwhensis TaxID=265425 RepID=UPI000373DBFA|nr:hypothetical protein [Salinimonas chungwhensis]
MDFIILLCKKLAEAVFIAATFLIKFSFELMLTPSDENNADSISEYECDHYDPSHYIVTTDDEILPVSKYAYKKIDNDF